MNDQPPPTYDQGRWAQILRALWQAIGGCLRGGSDIRLQPGVRYVIQSPNGTLYALAVDNAGNLSTTAYP